MLVFLSPIGGAGSQFFDNNGNPLTGGKLYTYVAGTTTPKVTYTSYSGITSNPNPIVLDSSGRIPGSSQIWLQFGKYKFILKTSTDVIIGTWDNVSGVGSTETLSDSFSGNGVIKTFNLTNAPFSKLSMSVYINGVYQERETYSLSNTTIAFSEAPPLTSRVQVLYN